MKKREKRTGAINWPLWWLQPYALLSIVIIPIYIASSLYMMGPVRVGAAKQFYGAIDLNTYTFLLGLGWLIVIALFSRLGQIGHLSSTAEQHVNPSVLRIMLLATGVGYVLFFVGALRGGLSQVADVVSGQTGAASAIKTSGQLFPGLSTMTQFGPAYCVGFAFLSPDNKRLTLFRFGFVGIILLSIARAVIWSERLAILEVCIPATIAWAVQTRGGASPFVRFGLSLAPFLGLAGLVVMFTAFESVRSWQHYAPLYGGDLFTFARERLILYYATALNNGASILRNVPHTTGQIYFSLDWLFRMPIVNNALPMAQYAAVSDDIVDLNMHYLDKEFTNPSGMFVYIWDYGPILAMIVAGAFGFFSGRMHRSLKGGGLVGKLVVPFLILGFLEILRVPILTAGRFFYVWVGILALIFFPRRSGRSRRRSGLPARMPQRPIPAVRKEA